MRERVSGARRLGAIIIKAPEHLHIDSAAHDSGIARVRRSVESEPDVTARMHTVGVPASGIVERCELIRTVDDHRPSHATAVEGLDLAIAVAVHRRIAVG